MNLSFLDWSIIAVFFLVLIGISIITSRLTTSVAGFLSAERCAGRYLLTIAGGMAFCAAIGIVAGWEAGYRNGVTGIWWGLMSIPINMILAMSGWVTYRYRQTRALTMGQFLEMRYSRNFRIFGGFMAFASGVLNCAVFPMVTANFLMWFLGLPQNFLILGLPLPTYHCLMLLMIGTALALALAGGQITIMVTDFFQGFIANAACIALVGFMLWRFGLDQVLDTLLASEFVNAAANPENLEKLTRVQGVSLLNPFKIGKLPDFGLAFFLMMAFVTFMQTGVWQGGSGYLTAAKTPHEGKMGNVLGQIRWVIMMVGSGAGVLIVYTVMWNPQYESLRAPVLAASDAMQDPQIQSQMFVPVALAKLLPTGLLGLLAVFMIGASISTDDSYYHSWGGTFLQDVIMPFRKKPFTTAEHLRYLRWSITGIAVFAFGFSSIWTLKDFIYMWFQITGSIYIGGASCAVIGGLYWRRGTTQGAWAGMTTGSLLSVGGIAAKQIWPEMAIGDLTINGLHMAVFSIMTSILVYITVSIVTCRDKFNLDQLLHRGSYALPGEHEVKSRRLPLIERIFGITDEFSKWDKFIYVLTYTWTIGWTLVFIVGTAWNLTHDVPSSSWRWWFGIHLRVLYAAALVMAVWFGLGSIRDVIRLIKDLGSQKINESDDGVVHSSIPMKEEEIESL